MKLQMVGCNHRTARVDVRERIAFSPEQIGNALQRFRSDYPDTEAVLLSTCNRVEFYTATDDSIRLPSGDELVRFLADFHGLARHEIAEEMECVEDEAVVRHLFSVAASLDSMVVGEAQILSQVKEAYELAQVGEAIGPLTHAFFQAAIRVAKMVASQTAIHEKRTSIPSVAVGDFVSQFYDRLDDKPILLIGAGEMGQETLRYLIAEGANDITILNRNRDRAEALAEEFRGRAGSWEDLLPQLVKADLVISTTSAHEPLVTFNAFQQILQQRHQRPIFLLDLAIPRDFAPAIGDLVGVYLYSVDDLQHVCDANQRARADEWPKAERIIEQETNRFLAEMQHRATVPTIRRLREQAESMKATEVERLFNKIDATPHQRAEIDRAFDRLVNKMLHPPLESLRDDAKQGGGSGLLEALKHLFQLRD